MDKQLETSSDKLVEQLLSDLGVSKTEEKSINFYAYWQVVLKYKWGIIALTILAMILSFLYTSSLQHRYKAVATMLYNPPSASNYGTVRNLAADGYSGYRDYRLFKSQQVVMKSRKFAADMVDEYKLWNHPYFTQSAQRQATRRTWKQELNQYLPEWVPKFPQPVIETAPDVDESTLEQRYRNMAINTVRGGITIESQEDIMLLKLGFVSTEPEFAAEMANKLAKFYGMYEIGERMRAFNTATEWLVTRTKELKDSLLESEQKYQQYKQAEGVGSFVGESTILTSQIEDIIAARSDARRRVQTITQTIDRLSQKSTQLGQSIDSTELLNFPAIRTHLQNEIDARNEIDQLALVYGPKHPKMISAVSNHRRAREKIDAEVALVKISLNAELSAARSELNRLSGDFAKNKAQLQAFEQKNFHLDSLEKSKQTDQELHDLFVTRFKELNIGSDVSTQSVRIIDEASRPELPFWPNKTRMIMMYSAMAMFFGVILAFVIEYLDKTIKLPEQVEEKLGVPLLGSLLQLFDKNKQDDINPENFFIDHKDSIFSESIRTIRSGIMLSGLDNPYKVIAITSSVPGEGKTTCSINIASAIGQLERVLLIDADMRRASLGPHFGIEKNTKGLADVTAGLEKLDDCIQAYEKGSIDILPAGTIPPNPQELLSSDKFRDLVEDVAGMYDRVIIDTPPTHLISDPKLVVRWASAVVYVVRAESTLSTIAAKGLAGLKKVNTPIIGVVLNGVSRQALSESYYYGSYGGGYGGGYSGGYGKGYGSNYRKNDKKTDKKTKSV